MNRVKIITPIYFILGIAYVVCLLLSNIVAGKLFVVKNLVLPAAVILFPVTYIFGDVLTEVYGFKGSRLIIWAGFAANLLMCLIFAIVVALPYPRFWNGQSAYATVLGMTPKVVLASMLGYFCGEFCNSTVLSVMKKLTKGKWLWTRTIGSTIVGEGVDTFIFISLVFSGAVAGNVLAQMIVAQYLFKVLYEIAATPLIYAVVGFIKRKEGLDIYDYGVKYNPFQLEMSYDARNLGAAAK